jgi:CBS domain-containing protein
LESLLLRNLRTTHLFPGILITGDAAERLLEHGPQERSFLMKVRELMIRNVTCCQGTQNLAEIAAILWNDGRGSLPVLNTDGTVASIITDRDVAIALGTRNLRASDVCVSDVVPARVFTCRASDNVFDALDTMVSQNIRRLPVVDAEDKPVGILSIDDLIRRAALARTGEEEFQGVVMRSVKKICDSREPGAAHETGELLVAHA